MATPNTASSPAHSPRRAKSPARGEAKQGEVEELELSMPGVNDYWNWDWRAAPWSDSHHAFRKKIRAWVAKNMTPFADEWEAKKEYPADLNLRAAQDGIYGAIWPREFGGTRPADFDPLHDQIFWEELTRCGTNGSVVGCFFITSIALPPVLNHGVQDKEKTREICTNVITGKKVISLAISEPYAGSDVANIRTSAVLDGDYYVVNGEKTYITGGMRASYFTTAVRTGGEGLGGISMLLIERELPGVECRRLDTMGWAPSFTTAISFNNVRVHKSMLIGEENVGFYYVMENFNHERWRGVCMAVRGMREVMEDAITYARQRKTFGRKLIKHQVILHKCAEMIRHTLACYALLEQITLMMKRDADDPALAGMIALAKVQTTKSLELVCREAMQIFGGRGYLRGGRGGNVERAYREVRVAAIGGGSEEVMMELGAKMARL